MGFAEELENRQIRMSKLLQTHTDRPLAELENGSSDEIHIQGEINETERKIEQMSRQLKANEDLKQQLVKDIAEKENKVENVVADLRAMKDETAKSERTMADLEFRRLQASAGYSEKDLLAKEKLVNNIKAYVYLTGANFSTPHDGYIMNRHTRKAKFFQVQGVPRRAATEMIWNAIKSTHS